MLQDSANSPYLLMLLFSHLLSILFLISILPVYKIKNLKSETVYSQKYFLLSSK